MLQGGRSGGTGLRSLRAVAWLQQDGHGLTWKTAAHLLFRLQFLLFGGYTAYFIQNWALKTIAEPEIRFREATLAVENEQIPPAIWLAAALPVVLAVLCIWLYGTGQYAQALRRAELDLGICTWFLALILSIWLGSRRTAERGAWANAGTAFQWAIGGSFALKTLAPVFYLPEWLSAAVLVFAGFAGTAILFRLSRRVREPLDPTPNECWKGGMFYFNPADAALFVEKRDGWAYTANFARAWIWVLLLSGLAPFAIFSR